MFSANDARANVKAYREGLEKEWMTKAEAWVEEVLKDVENASGNGATTYKASCKGLSYEVRQRASKILNDLGFATSFETGEFYRITW